MYKLTQLVVDRKNQGVSATSIHILETNHGNQECNVANIFSKKKTRKIFKFTKGESWTSYWKCE